MVFGVFAGLSAIWLLVVVAVELIHGRGRMSLALAATMGAGVLGALAFLVIPVPGLREAVVGVCTVVAVGSTAWLLVLLALSLSHRRLPLVLAAATVGAGVLVVELALEASASAHSMIHWRLSLGIAAGSQSSAAPESPDGPRGMGHSPQVRTVTRVVVIERGHHQDLI
jgi:hypothetical protein